MAGVDQTYGTAMNMLYRGDNFDLLRAEIGSETVDLVYLDPPLNPNANYKAARETGGGRKTVLDL